MRRARKVVVYLQDRETGVDETQLRQAIGAYTARGEEPVAVVHEEPGELTGLIEALSMVRDGEADRVMMASRDHLPGQLESATGENPSPWARTLPDSRPSPRHRRIRPTRRGGGEP